jgi:hypothetical protein
MRALLSFSKFSRLAGVTAVCWICGAGAAWAGGGGESLGSLQAIIGKPDGSDGLCQLLGMAPCPQFPTITQAVLEIAGLENASVEATRNLGAAGSAIIAGNAPRDSAPALSNPLPTLQILSPLAFIDNQIINNQRQAAPAQLFQAADTYFYAVSSGVSAQPDTLNLFYDDVASTKLSSFVKGQNVAAMSLPLVILNKDGRERAVMTTVQIVASCTGGPACLTANVTGDFSNSGNPQTRTAASLGINFAAVFDFSAVSLSQKHLIFGLQVPLLVTRATDPAYFVSASGQTYLLSPTLGTAFSADALGTKFSGSPIGIGPSPVPLCTSATCPPVTTPPTPPAPASFALCANLPKDGAGTVPVPAVAAFYAITVYGEVLLSAPVNPTSPIVCPF